MYSEHSDSSTEKEKLLDEESSSVEGSDTTSSFSSHDNKSHRRFGRLKSFMPWFGHGLSLMTCLTLLLYTLQIRSKMPKSCLTKFNSYCKISSIELLEEIYSKKTAPVLEAVDEDDFQDTEFIYSLWYQSPFKGPPTPAVHEAWMSIMRCK